MSSLVKKAGFEPKGGFQPNPELHTGELIVPKPTLTLVARLMWWLTGLQRKPRVATVRLQKIQRAACQRTFANLA
jgi:hypothetical protein